MELQSMSDPKHSLSVVVPTFNEAHHLPNLLDSLEQTLGPDCDIVVVDNGSTDATAEIAESSNCRLIRLGEKTFPSIARNIGARSTDSEILVFLDADIVVTPSWAQALESLRDNQEFLHGNVITGDSYQISRNPSWIEKYWFEPLRKGKKTYINGGNLLMTRKAFEQLGGFNEQLETGEDVDFSNRARQQGLKVVLDPAFAVHHEGFPKSIRHFFGRERWHGKGDFASLQYFRQSRVAQIALLIGLCYLLLLFTLPAAWYLEPAGAALVALLGGLGVVLLCSIPSLLKFRRFGATYSLVGTFIYFIYFNARLSSLFSVLRKR
jgi:GT2 family glycosyltransferase